MIRLQTPVSDLPCKVKISFEDKIMMLGSCFSENIGRQLKDFGFDVCINPFGTLYNPLSILQSVERLIQVRMFTEEDCISIGAGDERICSFSHHTSFARADASTFIADANRELEDAARHFYSCTKVIVTLGTSWCFRHIGKDFVVSNCLKRNASEFRRERLSAKQNAEILQSIITLCKGKASSDPSFREKEFIFTVSPIRHFKDGAHGNQLSKSALLLGIDDTIAMNDSSTDYFPAYEIVMDELRDYRFYAEDMCHPSPQAIDYIRERFLNWSLPENEHQRLEENIRNFRHSQHCRISR